MKPTEAQGELLGTLGPNDEEFPRRGARAVAAVALQVIANIREAVAHPKPHRAPCPYERDERGAILRNRSGQFLDPHNWTASRDPGWLVCARCGLLMETAEPERAAARFAAWLASVRRPAP